MKINLSDHLCFIHCTNLDGIETSYSLTKLDELVFVVDYLKKLVYHEMLSILVNIHFKAVEA